MNFFVDEVHEEIDEVNERSDEVNKGSDEDSKGNDDCKFYIVPLEKLAIICSAPSYKACILLVKATGWLFICVVYKYPC